MELKAYQYGESPDHVVYLTEIEARAVNGLIFFPASEEQTDQGYSNVTGKVRLPEGTTIEDYSRAADKLNRYLNEFGPIPCTENYLKTHDILTPIGD